MLVVFLCVCEKTGTDKTFRGAEAHTEAVSQLAQAAVVDGGLILVSSSLHRDSYARNAEDTLVYFPAVF